MSSIDLAQAERLPQGAASASGVVLRRRESSGVGGSFDLLLLLKGLGAMWVGAPGAASSRGRFGGGAEPMTWGDFSLYQSRSRLYAKSVDVREDFLAVRRSRESLTAAMDLHASLARKLPLGAENDRLMALLFGCMKHLALGADALATEIRFFWRWANLWGTAPDISACAECALSCGECAQATETGRPDISRAASKKIASLVSEPAANFPARSHEIMEGADKAEMRRAMEWISRMAAL